MKALNIFTSVAAAMIFFGCNDSEVVNPVEPKPGQEVDFTISYKDANNSRTIYGDEVDDGTNHYFPVNWVSTDQVFVMSDACNPATGQYGVGFEEGQQASAGKLKVIGDGLKWNTTATRLTGNFYSIYPYDKVAATSAAPADRKVTVRMPHIQNDYVTANGNSITAAPDMDAALLYAQTNEATNDQAVKLHYYNLATALRFELQGPANGENGVMIQEVSLIAPNGLQIAGNFELTFSDGTGAADNGVVSARPTFTPGTVDGSNLYDRVIIYSRYKDTEANLVLNTGDKVELNAFFMINGNTDMAPSENGSWRIQVKTLDKLYSLPISKVGTGKNLTLIPGQIQRLGTLPALSTESTSEWNVSNWMVNIPRNTYISEISVPGSWNSLNGDFQTLAGNTPSVADIINQYNIGARAFHFDARWKWSRNGVGLVTSGRFGNLGIADGTTSYSYTERGNNRGRVMNTSAVDFANALNTLAGQVKAGEYMILMCTFAQGSYDNPDKAWYVAISEACNTIENKANIFDASAYLTTGKTLSNAIVSDVLGKLIVVINMEGDITPANLPASSKCLFVNAPLTLTESMFADATSYNKGSLYANQAESDVTLYNTQAQITSSATAGFQTTARGYAPTLTERQTVAGGILDWALANYSKTDYKHDAWMYLGLGGYYQSRANGDATGYATLANSMNNWIDGKVTNMKPQPTGDQTRYFPVGIVLMNFVNNATYGTPVVKNILLLNNRYGLVYDPTQPAWPNQTQNLVESASRNHASGFKANVNGWNVF